MFPTLLEIDLPLIGPFAISSFGVMMALAFVAAAWVTGRRLRELGHDPERAADITLAAIVGGVLGAKLYYLVLNLGETLADPVGMIFSRAGLVWYGGLMLGAAAVAWRARTLGLRLPLVADVVAPALALGYGIGRIGCFLVGDDYGRPTDSWIGIAFPEGAPPTTAGSLRREFGVDLPPSIPDAAVLEVIPTQLFEAAAGIAIFALLWRLRGRRPGSGFLFGAWLVAAGLERFLIEFLRVKDDRFLQALTLAQLISVLALLIGASLILTARGPRSTGEAGVSAARRAPH